MANQKTRPHTYHTSTLSLCPQCRATIPAKILLRDGMVFMDKLCPEHGPFELLLEADEAFFRRAEALLSPGEVPRQYSSVAARGCPHDCGVCPEHEQRCVIPVIEITDHCNLECPICFAHNSGSYQMSADELERCLDRIEQCEGKDIDVLVISGGEPTVHPRFTEVMERCLARGFPRVAVNTNGVRLARDDGLAAFLAGAGVHVTLQLDSLRPEVYRRLRGRDLVALKLRALEQTERHGIATNVLQTVVRGVNDDEIGDIARLALLQWPCVRGLNIHIMTYTGKGGRGFPRNPMQTMTASGVARALEEQTGGLLEARDFTPMPFPHPRCALITYAAVAPGRVFPLPRFMPAERYLPLLTGGAIARPDDGLRAALTDTIDELWAAGVASQEPVLEMFRALISELFPGDRALSPEEQKRVGERHFKSVFIHSYMDEHTFDFDRLRKCCSMQVLPDGRMIPNCAYYVIHRYRDPRFFPARCY